MDIQEPSFKMLFEQLGLSSSKNDIEDFIEAHSPLDSEIKIWDAKFWTPAQAQFLREGIKSDADWAVIVDRFDARLRKELLSS